VSLPFVVSSPFRLLSITHRGAACCAEPLLRPRGQSGDSERVKGGRGGDGGDAAAPGEQRRRAAVALVSGCVTCVVCNVCVFECVFLRSPCVLNMCDIGLICLLLSRSKVVYQPFVTNRFIFVFSPIVPFLTVLSYNRYAVAALAEYRPLVLQLGEQDVCAAAVTSLVRCVFK